MNKTLALERFEKYLKDGIKLYPFSKSLIFWKICQNHLDSGGEKRLDLASEFDGEDEEELVSQLKHIGVLIREEKKEELFSLGRSYEDALNIYSEDLYGIIKHIPYKPHAIFFTHGKGFEIDGINPNVLIFHFVEVVPLNRTLSKEKLEYYSNLSFNVDCSMTVLFMLACIDENGIPSNPDLFHIWCNAARETVRKSV